MNGNGVSTVEQVRGDSIATMSQWQLIRLRFSRHRLAVVSTYVLGILYLLAAFAEFFAPYPPKLKRLDYLYCPPQPVCFNLKDGLHVRGVRMHQDPITFRREYTEDRTHVVPLSFFVRGAPYRLWGLIAMERHFFGVDPAAYRARYPGNTSAGAGVEPVFFLLGTDRYGRDILSRIIYGSRISLSIGLVAVVVTFLFGIAVGGISGYVGGAVDNVIQRAIEIVNSLPQLPLWLGLAAAMPPDWSPLRIYFSITIVLSLLSWTGLARVVRGRFLSLREEDYATAARLLGASHGRIIFRHLLPGFASHVIVSLTLSLPGMILGEVSLSFLGLGLREPVVSWGVMLRACSNMQVVSSYPWLLLPIWFIVLTVLSFNFLGDGLRDAADPYSSH